MTHTYTAEKRRLSPTPPRPLRELPVLFHLMDVSRPKGYSPPPAFSLGGPSGLTPLADEHDQSTSAPEFDLETAAKLVETKAFGSLPAEPIPAPPTPVTEQVAAASEEQSPEMAATAPVAIAPDAAALVQPDGAAAEAAPTLETPPPTNDDAVSLRERAMERSRKRQQTRKDDWFRSQGRFIIIGFIAALGVTIWAARANRKPAAPPVAVKGQMQPVHPRIDSKKADAKLPLASGPAVSITGVKPTTAKQATAEPKVVLHPPTIPQLAQEPATTSAPATDTLFTFSKRPEDRLASRTDDVGPISAAPTTETTPASTTPPLTSVPTLQPQYPATNYPANYQPVAPAGAASAPAATTAPLYPTTNSAGGLRNERNGSGLY